MKVDNRNVYPIKGLPDNCQDYYITTDGDVFSKKSNKWLAKSIGKPPLFNYVRFHLSINGNARLWPAHRLVGMTFISNKKHLPYINHKNGNKEDNRVRNLEWCTSDQNRAHASKNGWLKQPRGEDSKVSRIKNRDVLFIRKKYNQGVPLKQLAQKFGLSEYYTSRIASKKVWAHI